MSEAIEIVLAPQIEYLSIELAYAGKQGQIPVSGLDRSPYVAPTRPSAAELSQRSIEEARAAYDVRRALLEAGWQPLRYWPSGDMPCFVLLEWWGSGLDLAYHMAWYSQREGFVCGIDDNVTGRVAYWWPIAPPGGPVSGPPAREW